MAIAADFFIHPHDKAALDKLEAIPGFPMLVKKVMSMGIETYYYGINMASYIRLSEKQLPDIYSHLVKVCGKLGIPCPEMYLEMDPVPNAYTMGDTRISIVVTSGLLEYMDDEELDAVLAHECGHIICRHVLYHTVGDTLNTGASMIGPVANLITGAIQYGLMYWSRMSEYSADRVAALVTSPQVVAKTMARLAGGPVSITEKIDFKEWQNQAFEYENICHDGLWNNALQKFAIMDSTHPFTTVRVLEIIKWSQTDEYAKAKAQIDSEGFAIKDDQKIDATYIACTLMERFQDSCSGVYYRSASKKSGEKIAAAEKAYGKTGIGSHSICCYDDTLFGSASDGFLITTEGIYIHNSGQETVFLDIERLAKATLSVATNTIIIAVDGKFTSVEVATGARSIEKTCEMISMAAMLIKDAM